ncbi:MAG: 3-dehydroquinate synthase [Lachnospiraceae bacterium]|nr:3-dehydroquinate synthase [Lachnospiraceae bacterium]
MAKELIVNYENQPCYSIYIDNSYDAFCDKINDIPNFKKSKTCIVTDSNVANIYLNDMVEFAKNTFEQVFTFIIPAGEANKNLSEIEKLYEHLIINHFDRTDSLIALGGGVVGDMTGYTAATYLRGINFIQVPTTLLSQVDSSIGGKTGVDFNQYKNMVGAFHMPKLVYINTSTIKTLPEEQFQCGMGEIIKHGLIRNANYYQWLKDNYQDILNLKDDSLADMIYESCLIKKNVVEEDPTEQSIRGYLNFGHTIGHAIEKLSDFKLYHGQCVAIGMVAASYLSKQHGNITGEEYIDIINTIKLYNLPVKCSLTDSSAILSATKSDKKMIGNKVKFILLKSVGDAYINTDLTEEELLGAIEEVL